MESKRKSSLDIDTIKCIAHKDKEEGLKVIALLEKIFGKNSGSTACRQYYTEEQPQIKSPKHIPKVKPNSTIRTQRDLASALAKPIDSGCHTIDIYGEKCTKPIQLVNAENKAADIWKLHSPYTSLENMRKRVYDSTIHGNNEEKATIPQLISAVEKAHNTIKGSTSTLKQIENRIIGMKSGLHLYKKQFGDMKTNTNYNFEDMINKFENTHNSRGILRTASTPKKKMIASPAFKQSKKIIVLQKYKRKESLPINTMNYFLEANTPLSNKEIIDIRRRRCRQYQLRPHRKESSISHGGASSMRVLETLSKEITESNDMLIANYIS